MVLILCISMLFKDSVFQIDRTISTPECLLRNESLYLHVLISKDPNSDAEYLPWKQVFILPYF